MRRILIPIGLTVLLGAGLLALYSRSGGGAPQGAQGGRPGGGMTRPPMTVELAEASRAELAEHITVVGNLVGAATVEVVPRVSGRLEHVMVRLGDQVRQGQQLAKVEDQELREQFNQAEASFEVARATVRQREADLVFAETNLDRARSLHARQLLAQQALDDAEARHQAAQAQLDLARAQFSQAGARREELHIALQNTVITSPVDGFVGRRYLDAGGYASQNAPIVSVVEIQSVRLVANIVERDLRRVAVGVPALVEVDAYPGETFRGQVARISPVFDPATRTAEMEIEIPNREYRLKPGMYARVQLQVDRRADALVVPRNALVDVEGRRGVFVADADTARFRPVETGAQDAQRVEVTAGLDEGEPVVTTGAAGLRDGDRIILAGRPQGRPADTPADASGRTPVGRRPAG